MNPARTPQVIAAVSVLGLFLLVAVVFANLGGDESQATNVRRDEFPYQVFWLGESYGSHKLSRVIPPDPEGYGEPTIFIYGDCEKPNDKCVPSFVVKTDPQCDPEIRDGERLRGSLVRRGAGFISIETGFGAVYIHGPDYELASAAEHLSVRNPASPQETNMRDLPGSLCALARLHPRVYPTASTQEAYTPDSKAATVVSSFGGLELVRTYEDATAKLGWRPLRTRDWQFTLAEGGNRVGAIRIFKGFTSFEQDLHAAGVDNPIQVAQEPVSNSDFDRSGDDVTMATFGEFTGEYWKNGSTACFIFLSSETFRGEGIRVQACAHGRDGFESLRHFVTTLTFD